MEPYLQTAHLDLYAPTLADAPLFNQVQTDPDVMRYIGQGSRTDNQAEMLLMGCVYHQIHFGFSLGPVTERGQTTPIGQAGIYHFNLQETDPRIEIAFAFLKPYWQKGYATEVVEGLLEWGFTTFGITEVVAVAHPKNKASARVLEKNNFHYMKMSKREKMPVRYFKYKRSS
jgi:ribosomal-protein-alanine N-acetyltransferase